MTKKEMKDLRERMVYSIRRASEDRDNELAKIYSTDEIEQFKDGIVEKMEKIDLSYMDNAIENFAKSLVDRKGIDNTITYIIDKLVNGLDIIRKIEPEKAFKQMLPLGMYWKTFEYIGENLM